METLRPISNYLEKLLQDEDFNTINKEVTAKLQAMEKYRIFNKWLVDNGAVFPKLEYPVAFGRTSSANKSSEEHQATPENSNQLATDPE